ncbi:PBS lyase HEAT-like repeat-containing protein [Paenibacillus sp. UNCCL117]|uniref:FAD-dependent oxidoreductase n=1 Tax=unclassified Paenibacillus TaxID=185978 RepID=UPI000884B00A|nr:MULTISPECIES: FAD-dependent oxidoreductase [unclassified Paenibacillus]SDD02544.1 PBS lyase HEAT-like repeat-containing protein [Paenibacillus sp. cl123]SFW32470.1 PBS lyase HEAT-like repeat-containing protein [Paenibacillus sp. UNCCL117]
MMISERWSGQVRQTDCAPDLDDAYDVIVVGLGTAGAMAAIRAARLGMRVLGVERMHAMGGAGTLGGVTGYYFGTRGGIYEEMDRQTAELEAASFLKAGGVNAAAKSIVLERAAAQAGVDFHYESVVLGVIMEGRRVVGLRWTGPLGIRRSGCRVLIDASGEAEVCALAGCETRQGRDIDGQVQPFSNVVQRLSGHKVVHHYTDSGYVDAADPEALSRAIVESSLLETHLKPVYEEEPLLLKVVPQLGLREGRLIVGEETVTFHDFIEERYSGQPLFYAYSNLDNHSKDIAFESEAQQDWTVVAGLWGLNFTVPIPMGSHIPRGTEGLLVAGRSLSLDHDLAGCIRMKRDMQKSGEAAADMAYLSIRKGCSLKELPYEELRPLLEETGCLERDKGVEFKDSSMPAEHGYLTRKWLTDPAEIRQELAGTKPGIAIWSARRLGGQLAAELREWMAEAAEEEEEHLMKHSAMALGLIGDPAAIPALRRIVEERDMFVPYTSRKYNQVRGYAAIYLLGKLRDKQIVPELLRILRDPDALPDLPPEERNWEFISDSQELYFQYASYSVMALLRIGDGHPELRDSIAAAIRDWLGQPELALRISFKGSRVIKYAMQDRTRMIVEKHLSGWSRSVSEAP